MNPILNSEELPDGHLSTWEGYLTIQYLSIWKEQFSARSYQNGSVLTIDLANIQRIDTAGIQFLIFVKKYCLENQINLRLINHSLSVLNAYSVLGLVGFFSDKIKITKEVSKELDFSYGMKKES